MRILFSMMMVASVMLGCASISSDPYMNVSMKTVIKNEGSPTVVEYLDSETRAFIWRRNRIEDMPPSSLFVRQINGMPLFSDDESVRVRISCEYILIGKRTEKSDDNWNTWTVVGSIKPKFGC